MSTVAAPRRLVAIRKENRARKRGGDAVVYFCLDRFNEYMYVSQKIKTIVEEINSKQVDPAEPWARASVSGMFKCLNTTNGRQGGYHHGRWRIAACSTSDAGSMYEKYSPHFMNTVILGAEDAYEFE